MSLMLKLTFHGFSGIATVAVLLAVFIVFSWEYATGMSKTRISDLLQQPSLMLDIAVLIAVDAFCMIAFCFLQAQDILSRSQTIMLTVLKWFPGILIFPILMSLLTALIFSLSGVDFALISLGMAAVLLIAVPLLTYALKSIIPESDIRLELTFLINLMVLALGIVATVNGRTAVTGINEVRLDSLAAILALILSGTIAGIIINNKHLTKQISKLK